MWSAVFWESWQELRRIKAHNGETEMRGTTLALRVIVLGLTSCVEDLQGFTFLIDFIRVESFGILRDSCCDTHKFGTKVGFEYWLTCMRMRVFPWLFELYSALAYFAWGEFWNKFYFWFDFFLCKLLFFVCLLVWEGSAFVYVRARLWAGGHRKGFGLQFNVSAHNENALQVFYFFFGFRGQPGIYTS